MLKAFLFALVGVLFSVAATAAPLGTVTSGHVSDEGTFVEGDVTVAFQTTDGEIFATEAEAVAHQEELNLFQEVTEFLKDLGYVSSLDPARAAIVDHKDTIEFIYGGGDFEPTVE